VYFDQNVIQVRRHRATSVWNAVSWWRHLAGATGQV